MKLTEELAQAYQLLGSARGSGVVVVFDEVVVDDDAFALDLGMLRSHNVVNWRWAFESVNVKEMVEALWDGFRALKMEMLWRA